MSLTKLSKVKIGLVQSRCAAQPAENLALAIARIHEAADGGAQIVCLQELFTSLYFCQVEDHKYFALAEEIPGPSTDALAKVARERAVVIVASLFEKRGAGLYHNTAAIIDCGWLLSREVSENAYPRRSAVSLRSFTSRRATLGFRAWQTRYAKIGVCICWDQWYPEAARLTALRGAEILFYPTAIGWHPTKRRSLAPGSTTHGRRSSAVTRSRMAVTWRCRIEWDMKRRTAGAGIEFWGQSFVGRPGGADRGEGVGER
jgi:N-carbamoylputrescine amidase